MSGTDDKKKSASVSGGGGWLALLSSASEPQQGKRSNAANDEPSLNEKTLAALATLESSLTCFYCKKLFQSPVSIAPCHHCFCSDCLSSAWAETLSTSSYMMCPLCDNTTLEGGLESFPRNRCLEETVDLYRTIKPLLQELFKTSLLKSSPSDTKAEDEANKAKAKWAREARGDDKVTAAARASWDEHYNRLIEFRNTYGHTRVRYQNDGDLDFKKFADWVRNQRYLLAKRHEEEGDSMAEVFVERIEKLNKLGFDWSIPNNANTEISALGSGSKVASAAALGTRDDDDDDDDDDEDDDGKKKNRSARNTSKWDSMYDKLAEYYKEHGTTVIGDRADTENKKLHDWTRNQKYWLGKKLQDGRLSPVSSDRIEKLAALNFPWSRKMPDQPAGLLQQHLEDAGIPMSSPSARRVKAEKVPQFTKTPPAGLVGKKTEYLAETLGKVLGALDNLGALNNLGDAAAAGQNSRKRTASAAGLSKDDDAGVVSAAERKRVKLERKLDRVNQQLTDAEQNVSRFQIVNDETMAAQAKTRMVDLYNKKVELEQDLLVLADDEEEDKQEELLQQQLLLQQASAGKKKSRKMANRMALASIRRKSPAEIKRARLDRKLELVGKQLADAEKSITRFQSIRDDGMVEQAKTRMAKLYNDKVDIENELMDMDDEEDDDYDDDVAHNKPALPGGSVMF
ncbi:hypothetical protein ACA910_007698 [Epithemia clementina (nom. ined.)]